ncbi:MAG TPA: TonB-dependent receptor [Sphingomicrobium sp.]|nr:TonB-dependent receptor [Sphingomicrobium sp.]
MNIHRSVGVFLAGTCAAVVGTPALAQNSDATAPNAQPPAVEAQGDQNAIVVTAQKRPQVLIDVPQSVSVISGDTLEKTHAQRLSDYLTRIPSATVVESQPGSSRIVLRGINTGGVGATVATYIDETPFGSATALANGGVLAPDIDPFDLARVEVLRGPQGTLYGANSLGGLVKFVTVAPDPSAFGGAGELGGETVSHGDASWWGRAAFNVPLSGNAAFRASGFYRRDPGYIDDPALGHDVNDGKTYGGRVSFLVRPTDQLSVRASAHVANIRSNGTNAVDIDPATMEPVGGSLEQVRILNEPNNIDYRIYNTTIDYDFGPVALVSSTSYGTLDQAQIVDGSGALGVPGAGLDQSMTQRRFTQEVRLASSAKQTIEWTIGGFYTHEKNRLGQAVYLADPVTQEPVVNGLIIVDLPSRYREYAGFANATWHISPKFDLTAGARYSHNRQSSKQDTTGALVAEPIHRAGKSSDSAFTYSVAPTFKLNANTRIYARVAKGYRPGGPNAVSADADPNEVPFQFAPDTTINYEAGIKTSTEDNLLSLDASVFRIDWKKIQLLVQIGQFGVNINGASARSSGVEVTAGLHPSPGLSFFANGSYVDAHLTGDTPAQVGGVSGDPLPYSPKWQWTVGAEYERRLSATVTGSAGVSWHYTGHRFTEFDPVEGQHRLGSYGQIDAHAGVEFGRFRVDAFGHNLTDSRGITNVGFFGDVNGDLAAAVIRPRSFGLALGYRY